MLAVLSSACPTSLNTKKATRGTFLVAERASIFFLFTKKGERRGGASIIMLSVILRTKRTLLATMPSRRPKVTQENMLPWA